MDAEEKRSASLFVNIRPSLRRRIDVDAASKGQKLAEWAERAFLIALNGNDETETATPSGE